MEAYFQTQDIVFKNECDLSVYRFKLSQVSHVAVLGEIPDPPIQDSLAATLSRGTPADLPADISRMLIERRKEAQRLGPWVEGHYRPGRRL
jgi:hypothetical protein